MFLKSFGVGNIRSVSLRRVCALGRVSVIYDEHTSGGGALRHRPLPTKEFSISSASRPSPLPPHRHFTFLCTASHSAFVAGYHFRVCVHTGLPSVTRPHQEAGHSFIVLNSPSSLPNPFTPQSLPPLAPDATKLPTALRSALLTTLHLLPLSSLHNLPRGGRYLNWSGTATRCVSK